MIDIIISMLHEVTDPPALSHLIRQMVEDGMDKLYLLTVELLHSPLETNYVMSAYRHFFQGR